MFLGSRIVTTTEGRVRGMPCGNPAYTVFKGIPFARPPVGALRWAAPQASEPWEGIRDCMEFPAAALQVPGRNAGQGLYHKEFKPCYVEESEDCLYLNIWTPDLTPEQKMPVMFWIHGGGFVNGYSYEMEFDGEAFCKRGTLLVTVPYRLAAMGFFAHRGLSARDPDGRSGNYALLDLVRALRWVRENIAAFGGDPENITVFGQSAGGAMTQALCCTPLTEGLFRRAIVQSAGGITTVGNTLDQAAAEELGERLCEQAGVTLEELLEMDGPDANALLLAAAAKVWPGGLFFGPVLQDGVLPQSSGDAMACGRHHRIDYMTGSVAGDGGLFFPLSGGDWPSLQAALEQHFGPGAGRCAEELRERGIRDPAAAARQICADCAAVTPLAWAMAELINGRQGLYVYYFDRQMPGDDNGAFHSSELWYMFGTLNRCWRTAMPGFTANDYLLSEQMLDYWTNFARTGDPNGPGLPHWAPYAREGDPVMRLNETLPGMQPCSSGSLTEELARLTVLRHLGQ